MAARAGGASPAFTLAGDIRLFGDFLKIILYLIWLNISFVEDVNVSCHPLVASHSVKGTGAFSEAPVLFAFGALGAETLAPSGGPGVFFRFCYSMWLFHLHSAVKIRPFSGFPLGGIHGSGILPVIPLELQGKKHQPFSIPQPFF